MMPFRGLHFLLSPQLEGPQTVSKRIFLNVLSGRIPLQTRDRVIWLALLINVAKDQSSLCPA